MNKISYLFIMTVGFIPSLMISTNFVHPQEDGNTTDAEMPKFFAIQHANSGSIVQINETAYTLGLNDISDKTILFSDKPDRIVTSTSTADFIGNWSTGQDSFAKDASNAVLVVDEIEGKQDITIIEFFNPIYNSDKKKLKYEITADNATSIELPSLESTIVIDESYNHSTLT